VPDFTYPKAQSMMTRIVIILTVLLASCDGPGSDSRPNVILLMADDMGWAQTGTDNLTAPE
jgi:hypothetical protein